MTDDQRRSEDRVTINQEFESFDAFIDEYVTNLSRSGAFIKTRTPLTVGQRVDLRFTVLQDSIETIEGVGEVVRVEEGGMGVVFREIGSASKAILDRLLIAKP